MEVGLDIDLSGVFGGRGWGVLNSSFGFYWDVRGDGMEEGWGVEVEGR